MFKLTKAQKNHLRSIKIFFSDSADIKYVHGAKEHGGNLFDFSLLQLVDASLDECVDQFTYLTTLRAKLLKEIERERLNTRKTARRGSFIKSKVSRAAKIKGRITKRPKN